MALSQADFYAYSRATGTPVPRDPEEQAKMAPDVLNFRRNQLSTELNRIDATAGNTQQGFGLPQALGIGAAVAGLGAAGYGISRLLRQKPAAAVAASAVRPATVDLESAVRRVAAEGVPQTQAAPVRSSSLPEVRPSVAPPAPRIAAKVDLSDEFSTSAGYLGATPSKLRKAEGFTPRKYLESTGALPEQTPDLTTVQTNLRPQTQDQVINAVESGEDQATGRIKTQLQRNEDYDLSQVEMLEEMAEYSRIQGMEQDEPITRVASSLPDGAPIDQAERASNFARQQLEMRRQSLAEQGLSPGRIERELVRGPEGTRVKQASELYAATGDPETLNLMSQEPSLPLVVQPRTQVSVGKASAGDVDIPTSTFYRGFKNREVESPAAVEADIHYTNLISSAADKISSVPQFVDNPAYTQLVEQTNMAQYAMKSGDPVAGRIFNQNRELFRSGKAPSPKIVNPEYQELEQTINMAMRAREGVRSRQQASALEAERFPTVQALKPLGEGTRVFGKTDPVTGELIQETIEFREGRPSLPAGLVTETATGRAIRGRVGAEGTIHGPTPGIFEPPAILTETELKPESLRFRRGTAGGSYEAADSGKGLQYQAKPVMWDPNVHAPEQRTPEGFVYSDEAMLKPSQPIGREVLRGAVKSPYSIAKPSVDVSSKLRQLQLRGRPGEAEAFLQSFKQGIV
jgi:hypothetical protein